MSNPYKQKFHLEPEKGLLNDPNGLAVFNGVYYFFHQWNRFDTTHEYKEWGLFTSKDLIHWESQGTAILPDSKFDKNGVYSGSGIVKEGKYYLFYTGNTKTNGARKSFQCTSISEDGRTWIKQATPIETPNEFTEHFRDPKVFSGTQKYWMVVGAQDQSFVGRIALFSSNDLNGWEYEGLLTSDELENMCECPDLILDIQGADLLVACPQVRVETKLESKSLYGYAVYKIGKFDERQKRFESLAEYSLVDEGFDFYAPQTFKDENNRVILSAWMCGMNGETEPACPTITYGYIHCLTIPRVLTIREGKLFQNPIQEIESMRQSPTIRFDPQGEVDMNTMQFEILVDLIGSESDFYLSLNEDAITLSYFKEKGEVSVSRKNWATNKIEKKAFALAKLTNLRLFFDASSVEFFFNGGEKVFTSRFFEETKKRKIQYNGLPKTGTFKYHQLN